MELIMRLSRFWLLALVAGAVLLGTNCSYYNKVMARKNLVDGSKAYKDRKFADAERLFRYAASLDPNGTTMEGRTAQLSLARTLHSMYIGDRSKKEYAQQALDEYKKSLPQMAKDLTDVTAKYEQNKNSADLQRQYFADLSAVNSTTGAIANLLDTLDQKDEARQWQLQIADDASMPITARARALSSLASKANSCANDISDTEATKKTVKKDGKDVFQFVKPANADDFTKLKQCVEEGQKYVDQALALEPPEVKNAASLDLKSLNDIQLAIDSEIFKVFESVRSYKAALTNQAMRIAEMDGNTAERDRLKDASDAAKNAFSSLSDVVKSITAEQDARAAAKEEAEKGAAANANANK